VNGVRSKHKTYVCYLNKVYWTDVTTL